MRFAFASRASAQSGQFETPFAFASSVCRLYTLRAALDARLGRDETMELLGTSYTFVYNKLRDAASRCSLEELGQQVCLCAEYDYRMKSTGLDPGALLRELFARLAAGV